MKYISTILYYVLINGCPSSTLFFFSLEVSDKGTFYLFICS